MITHKRNSLGGTRKVSPPQPTCMTDEQKASYLTSLRQSRPARPVGSRPLPGRPAQDVSNSRSLPRPEPVLSSRRQDENSGRSDSTAKEMTLSKRTSMQFPAGATASNALKGRPLVPAPNQQAHNPHLHETPIRQLEREEARALREALNKIDQKDEEQRVYDSAKDEATDLVWKHRNPGLAEAEKTSAYRNPDIEKKHGQLPVARGALQPSQREPQPSDQEGPRSTSDNPIRTLGNQRGRLPWLRKKPQLEEGAGDGTTADNTPASKVLSTPSTEVDTASDPVQHAVNPKPNRDRRRSSGARQISSGSGKGMFRNPEDQIYEEPEQMAEDVASVKATETSQELPLRTREHNSVSHGARPLPAKPQPSRVESEPQPKVDRFEIWRNPPTQSRNADYTANQHLPPPQEETLIAEDPSTPKTRAMEIRSEEIRAATSMRKKDRSPKLPTPTAVSDRPGRPIVSFDPKWQPASLSARNSEDLERSAVRLDSVSSASDMPTITIMEHQGDQSRRKRSEDSPGPRMNRLGSVPSIELSQTHTTPSVNVSNHDLPSSGRKLPSQPVPTIQLPEDSPRPLPSIRHPDENASQLPVVQVSAEGKPRPLPSIHVQDGHTNRSRPLPSIQAQGEEKTASRPLPSVNVNAPNQPSRALPSQGRNAHPTAPQLTHNISNNTSVSSRVPWLSRTPTTASSPSMTCTACSLPIAGRVITASGASGSKQKARFHPECFSCHHCSTSLECISFYPEPDASRHERILTSCFPHLDPSSPSSSEDANFQSLVTSNSDLRFFCHLDFHELFSPRCHTCKTPIEGAIVLALGRHYHPEHFFCAECGDPFSSESPFVEHNNYPYCVSCHTKRTSARCRACKRQILDEMTVEALGGKWHNECFVCWECEGDFGDEGRFFVREIDVELTEKERRKFMVTGMKYDSGAATTTMRKVEERAVCQACEERRVKNVNLFL